MQIIGIRNHYTDSFDGTIIVLESFRLTRSMSLELTQVHQMGHLPLPIHLGTSQNTYNKMRPKAFEQLNFTAQRNGIDRITQRGFSKANALARSGFHQSMPKVSLQNHYGRLNATGN